MTGWDWWVVVGGTLQAVGVLVLVVGIARSSRRTQAYRTRPQVIEGKTLEAAATVFTPTIVTEPKPPIEERLDRLEETLVRMRDDLEERIENLRTDSRDAADQAAARATRHGERRFEALERLIVGETKLDQWVRIGSIAAIVLGVILATVGSVAGG